MASQAEIEDEIYARRLQSEEMEIARATGQTTDQDSQLARRLERQASLQPSVQPAASFALQPGQAMYIKLHHCVTNRQIGDTLIAHFLPGDDMLFETVSQTPTRYLRVKESGSVEFSLIRDSMTLFKTESSTNGRCLFLVSKPYITRTNSRGGRGWYLSMSATGQVYSNGPRDGYAEWMLISASNATSSSTTEGVVLPPPVPAATTTALTSPTNTFPGVDAGKDTLLAYFATSVGQSYLQSQAEYVTAMELYQSNPKLLTKLLHRPDWPFLATSAIDYPVTMETIPFNRTLLDTTVPYDAMKGYFEQGYMILPNVISSEQLAKARKVIAYWEYKHATMSSLTSGHGNGMKKVISPNGLEYLGDILHDLDLLSLYYSSILPHILQGLLGENDLLHPKTVSRILSTFPSYEITSSLSGAEGTQWTIDGFTVSGGHSPYNILIGVVLTDMEEEEQGNFSIYPGSHMILLEEYRRKVQQKSTLFSDNPKLVQKPDLGLPLQLKLKAGDVFLCTQRLAYAHTRNTSSQPTTIVYYRISHIDHAVLKDPALQSMWLEYKYASSYLEDDNAGICLTEDTLDAYDINVVHDTTATATGTAIVTTTASSNNSNNQQAAAGEDLLDFSASAVPVVAIATAHAIHNNNNNANVTDDDDDEDVDAPLLSARHYARLTNNTTGDVELQPLMSSNKSN